MFNPLFKTKASLRFHSIAFSVDVVKFKLKPTERKGKSLQEKFKSFNLFNIQSKLLHLNLWKSELDMMSDSFSEHLHSEPFDV